MDTSTSTYTWQIQISDDIEAELLIAFLSDAGISGFEEQERALLAYCTADENIRLAVNEYLDNNGHSYNFSSIAAQNWNALWEANFQPILVDHRVYLRAHFHEPLPEIPYDLVITPKMSFGTGHHATTRQMISAMLTLDWTDKTVLDYGTGTGILAILADKLGAKSILAIDHDAWSFENAAENITVNQAQNIKLLMSEDWEAGLQLDIILANINLHVLLASALRLSESLKQGGKLLVSGILTTDVDSLIAQYETIGLQNVSASSEHNWACIVFTKS